MENRKLIDLYYKQSVKDLDKEIIADKNAWYEYIKQLPAPLQVVYTITNFHQQLFKGGFQLYFSRPLGQFAYLALENLWIIQAKKSFMILKGALNEVNADLSTADAFRQHVFEGRLKRMIESDEELITLLNELDTEYYSVDEDIEELLANYIKRVTFSNSEEQLTEMNIELEND